MSGASLVDAISYAFAGSNKWRMLAKTILLSISSLHSSLRIFFKIMAYEGIGIQFSRMEYESAKS